MVIRDNTFIDIEKPLQEDNNPFVRAWNSQYRPCIKYTDITKYTPIWENYDIDRYFADYDDVTLLHFDRQYRPTENGYYYKNVEVEDGVYDYRLFESGDASVNILVIESQKFTVTFDGANAQSIAQGGKAIEPATPTRDGYEFIGWYVEGTNNEWDFDSDTVTANVNLVSKWQQVQSYTITYNLNGGTGASNGTYTASSATITLPTPTREGYTFGGWYDNADFEGTAVTEILTGSTGNKTFYAKWTSVGGGSGTNQPEKKGCKSSIIGVTGLVSIVAFAGATLAFKSRKED